MKAQIDNPFLISGYISPRYFCDREAETAELIDTLKNGRNLTLTSPRRMGKTGLILHAFHRLKTEAPEVTTIYIDLYATENLNDFTKTFAAAVAGQLDSTPMKALKKAAALLSRMRPALSVDELSGTPKISVDIAPGEEHATLEQIFKYLQSSGKRCYIAFDEFQQIAEYPEKNMEALLRSHIQNLHNVGFIFSGSKLHMLAEMFLSPKRPFYQSTSNKSIGTIPEERYYPFAATFFRQQGRKLAPELFHTIYSRYEGHTWYVQKVLNQIYGKSGEISGALVDESVNEILRDNEYYFQMVLRAYAGGQVKLLKAIAAEGAVRALTAGSFLRKYNLSAASSIRSSLQRLIDDELVYESDSGYVIYDRFFGEWLKKTF